MPLFQSTFRGRLRLFFAVIVIVPMIAVGIVLFQLLDAGDNFKLDSRLAQAQTTAQNLYTQRRGEAMDALDRIQHDVPLATAIKRNHKALAEQRLRMLARDAGLQRVTLELNTMGTLDAGSNEAIAAAQAGLADNNGTRIGTITASTTAADDYAHDVKRLNALD